MNKKGQAAMEFLMTYGWAILAAVIVIGVLASFGVFSPSKYVPTSCVLSAPFGCDQNQVAASVADGISLVVRNGGGESEDISAFTISGCTGAASTVTPALPATMADQATQTFVVTCDPALTLSDKFNGDVSITYTPTSGGVLDLTSSGSVTVEVAA